MRTLFAVFWFTILSLAASRSVLDRRMMRASDVRHSNRASTSAQQHTPQTAPPSTPLRAGVHTKLPEPYSTPGVSTSNLIRDRQLGLPTPALEKAGKRLKWMADHPPSPEDTPRVTGADRRANWAAANRRFDRLQREAKTIGMVRGQTKEDPILQMDRPRRENGRTWMDSDLGQIMRADRDRRPAP